MISESTFLLLIAIWTGVAVCTFVLLQFVTAPFGRHSRSDWGPTLPNRLAWIIMEFPPVSLFPLLFFMGPTEKTSLHYLFFALYFGHYLYRDLVFPFRIRTSGKRMPWAVCASGVFFNLVNVSIIGAWLGWFAHFDPGWRTSPQLIGGLTLFLAGLLLNLRSDNILIGLRDGNDTGYQIPRGGAFRWVSCPNHLGEILQWTGFAIAAWHPAALSFAVWTAANLLPRAVDHHEWYLRKFPEYPPERKAVLPGIW